MNKKPLVTFALLAYNQERFIEEAIYSALNQDYSPLEIVIVDDFSSDGTFEIIKYICEKYIGPHKIIFKKNIMNIGITEGINEVMRISKGEFIIGAAGDDIHMPNRVSILTKIWMDNNKPISSIFSSEDSLFCKVSSQDSSVDLSVDLSVDSVFCKVSSKDSSVDSLVDSLLCRISSVDSLFL